MNFKFSSTDICVLTPTKNRPHKIINLLNSLIIQSQKVGRIIVVGSGENIDALIKVYFDKLPIEYYHSSISGQIRQRKLGITKLDDRTKLVANIDDDIVLEGDAIERIIEYWNTKDDKTAGVGFNITNIKKHNYNRILTFLKISSSKPGVVLKSGLVTQITNINTDIESEWLNGGATTWRQDILISRIHEKFIDAKWSPCEDLILSYPIGKEYKLFVCSKSKVIHDDIIQFNLPFFSFFYKGKMLSIWLLYFVSQHKELSISAWILALISMASGEIIINILKWRIKYLGMPIGRFVGMVVGITYILRKKDISSLIH
jgi:glycosyltransferase involved in cell wall biosynthesis